MKKIIAFISGLLMLTAAAFADVSVKKTDDGKVEVTFFYANPRASEVLLLGDWNGWDPSKGDSMIKTDSGFTLSKIVAPGSKIKYKFYADGNWTEDMHEPDKVDDGFGGHNGLVDVDALLAGTSSDAGSSSAHPSLKFLTYSMVGGQNKWNTADNQFQEESAGLGFKSYWKFSGNVTPHIPLYLELTVADNAGFSNLYSSTLPLEDGVRNISDIIFDPIAYFNGGGENATSLGAFKTGIETPYLTWSMGYKYAKLDAHTNVNWLTVSGNWDAGYSGKGGYSIFGLGSAGTEFISSLTNGAVQVKGAVSPNKTANRAGTQYGMFGWLSADILGSHYIDLQYNGAYGSTLSTLLDTVGENDLIFGYRGKFGPALVKANYLYNLYGSTDNGDGTKNFYTPASSDVGAVNDNVANITDNMAANVNVTYTVEDLLTGTVGYRFRGEQANLMYVKQADSNTEISDNLGAMNRQRIWADLRVTPVEGLSFGLNPYLEMTFNSGSEIHGWNSADNLEIYVKPSASYSLTDILGFESSVDCYAEMLAHTSESDKITVAGDAASAFVLNEAGLKFSSTFDEDSLVKNLSVMYGFDANSSDYALHTLIASAELPLGINVQAGAGLRFANFKIPENGAFGFFVGANKVLREDYKTILYANFVYGMDPYKGFGDGQDTLNLDGYTVGSDANNYMNAAALRLGVRFNF